MGIEPQQLAPPCAPAPSPTDIAPDSPPSASSPVVQAPASDAPESPAINATVCPVVPPPPALTRSSAPAAKVTLERAPAQKPARPSTPRSASRSRDDYETPFARRYSPAPDDHSGAPHHERRCTICRHAERSAIEDEFIHWHAPGHIAADYQVSRAAIFRHAHATNLFERRNRKIRFALGHLIERVCDVEPTADSVVRAIHAFCRVNDDGHWVEPPSHVVVSSGSASARHLAQGAGRPPIEISVDANVLPAPPDEPSQPVLTETPSRIDAVLTETPLRLENDPTH